MTARPTKAQIAALRLAQRDPIRYYKGGAYSIPSVCGDWQLSTTLPRLDDKTGTTPQSIRACVERGWLVRSGDSIGPTGYHNIYADRWTITDAGRAVLAQYDTEEAR